MNEASSIYVAGHTGLVGSAVVKKLHDRGYKNIITRTRKELDLMDPTAVKDFFEIVKPEYVVDCAAKVGGIQANIDYPAEFLYENLQIQNNLMWSAHNSGVKKFLYIGSAVVYPNDCPQPIKEEYFMQGEPDQTKTGYAYAKIVGLKFCRYINEQFDKEFISCLPTNLYGEGDNFDPQSAHVIPALMRRLHEAKIKNIPEVTVWGSGNARREFLHVDDLVDGLIWLLENYKGKQFLNIGTGEDISMRELAEMLKDVVGYEGKLVFDATKPEGMPRRLFDVSRLHELGWHHKVTFEDGLRRTYAWYLDNIAKEAV